MSWREIERRIKALEAGAPREPVSALPPDLPLLGVDGVQDFLIAVHLGGCREADDLADGFARALGYRDGEELEQARAHPEARHEVTRRREDALDRLFQTHGFERATADPRVTELVVKRLVRGTPEDLRERFWLDAQAEAVLLIGIDWSR